ncbi:hypothetical protein [Candidatus Cyrtobacter comes]|nr:hypothetical protein [Candidatus Cyrtobacter comes]
MAIKNLEDFLYYALKECNYTDIKMVVDLASSSTEFTKFSDLLVKLPLSIVQDPLYRNGGMLLRLCIKKSGIGDVQSLDSGAAYEKLSLMIDRLMCMPESFMNFNSDVQADFLKKVITLDTKVFDKITKNLLLIPLELNEKYKFLAECQNLLLKAALDASNDHFASFIKRITEQLPYETFIRIFIYHEETGKLLIKSAFNAEQVDFDRFINNCISVQEIAYAFGFEARELLVNLALYQNHFVKIADNLAILGLYNNVFRPFFLQDRDQKSLIKLAYKMDYHEYVDLIKKLNSVDKDLWGNFDQIKDGILHYAAEAATYDDFHKFVVKLRAIPQHILKECSKGHSEKLLRSAHNMSAYQFDILVSKLLSVPTDLYVKFTILSGDFWNMMIDFALTKDSLELDKLFKNFSKIPGNLYSYEQVALLSAAFDSDSAFQKLLAEYEAQRLNKAFKFELHHSKDTGECKIDLQHGDKKEHHVINLAKTKDSGSTERVNKLLKLGIIQKLSIANRDLLKAKVLALSDSKFDDIEKRLGILSKIVGLDNDSSNILIKEALNRDCSAFNTLESRVALFSENGLFNLGLATTKILINQAVNADRNDFEALLDRVNRVLQEALNLNLNKGCTDDMLRFVCKFGDAACHKLFKNLVILEERGSKNVENPLKIKCIEGALKHASSGYSDGQFKNYLDSIDPVPKYEQSDSKGSEPLHPSAPPAYSSEGSVPPPPAYEEDQASSLYNDQSPPPYSEYE